MGYYVIVCDSLGLNEIHEFKDRIKALDYAECIDGYFYEDMKEYYLEKNIQKAIDDYQSKKVKHIEIRDNHND